jgi:hypothetical protein
MTKCVITSRTAKASNIGFNGILARFLSDRCCSRAFEIGFIRSVNAHPVQKPPEADRYVMVEFDVASMFGS